MSLDEQISVRIPSGLARDLEATCQALEADRSGVIRTALRLYLEGLPDTDRPWDRIEHLAGAARGGRGDLGARHRERLKEMLGDGGG